MQVNKNEQRIGVFKWIPRYKILFGYSAIDKQYIYNNAPLHGGMTGPQSEPNTEGLRWLMADELTRRIRNIEETQVSSEKVLQNTKTMIWADMWDPEYLGGYFDTYQAIDKLNPTIKDKLIFMPWNYKNAFIHSADISIDASRGHITFNPFSENGNIIDAVVYANAFVDITGHYYNADKVFKHFQDKSCKTIYCWSYPLGDPNLETETVRALFNYVDASKTYSNNIGTYYRRFGTLKSFHSAW